MCQEDFYHGLLVNGSVVIRGGGTGCAGIASYHTTVYVPDPLGPGTLVAGPDESWPLDPNHPDTTLALTWRWYPTSTANGNGNPVSTDGWCEGPEPLPYWGNGNIPVVLEIADLSTPSTWTWDPLYTAEYNRSPNYFNIAPYQLMFLLSDGKLFMAGADFTLPTQADRLTRKLDPATEHWETFPQTAAPIVGRGAVLYQRRNASDAVETVVMKAGGVENVNGIATPTSRATEIVVSGTNPTWAVHFHP